MKRWGRRKELRVLKNQDDFEAIGKPEVSTLVDRIPHESEEEYGLFTLHDLPHDQSSALDIVAVHGLGGGWRKTWNDAESRKNWLRDYLPRQLESQGRQARVLSYGYNSGGILSKAVGNIDDVAQELLVRLQGRRSSSAEKSRPILFIAHSLGGVVVKKAMIIAHERSSKFGDLRDKVQAFVFLGVPHKGSDLAFWYKYVIEVSTNLQMGFAGNPNFVAHLQKNSENLANISTQSIERLQSPTIDIRTFYESDKILNQLIVDKSSAVLNLQNEIATQISSTNHRTICKFGAEEAQTYQPVWNAIFEITEHALFQQHLTLNNHSVQKPSSILELPRIKAGKLSPHVSTYECSRNNALYAERTPTGRDKRTRKFTKAYLEPPRVLISISHLDFSPHQPLRARANVSEVTPVSFRPLLETWADSQCYGISGSWLEIAPGDTDVQTGRCNTFGLDKTTTDEQDMHIIRHVSFYHKYEEAPSVICYLVSIDSSKDRNHRMQVEALSTTKSGFELHFRSWADSIVYELEAEWVAFSKDKDDMYALPDTIVGANTILRFPEKRFERPPACFLAFSYLDITSGQHVSIKVSVQDVNEAFALIGFETWNDCHFWQIRVTGVAVL
ncbi:MAG: hypothetical protein M1812_006655 [Candelaria pacifica]|nr:MAG: hypothetical protein M1812_006655 [Candelaria pacifica]